MDYYLNQWSLQPYWKRGQLPYDWFGAGVYALYEQPNGTTCTYVGQSKCLERRLVEHYDEPYHPFVKAILLPRGLCCDFERSLAYRLRPYLKHWHWGRPEGF